MVATRLCEIGESLLWPTESALFRTLSTVALSRQRILSFHARRICRTVGFDIRTEKVHVSSLMKKFF